MLTLGNIIYSNCFPVHAGIITGVVPFPFRMLDGVPAELNRLLYEGKVDVSPSSSIEFAMNAGRYLLLPDLSITSRDKVKSIILLSRVPLADLGDRNVALTSASATSVVLLRVLLELREGVSPNYFLYEQGVEEPGGDADAFLTIGDLALLRESSEGFPHRYDLGELWHDFTGLPFVFALWQVNYRRNAERDLEVLARAVNESKRYGLSHLRQLAAGHAERFGLEKDMLEEYWSGFNYDLGDPERKGLLAFYGYAAELGAIQKVPELRIWGQNA